MINFEACDKEESPEKGGLWSSGKKKKAAPSGENLYSCLEMFRTPEILGKDNEWYCGTCKEHVQASKIIEIYKVPPVLVFCIQRFKQNNIYFKEKNEENVNFPIDDLDMTPFVLSESQIAAAPDKRLLYDLYAVSNHSGTLSFGHYTAMAKDAVGGKWHDYNDSHVSEVIDTDEVVSPEAYVLYYRRKDFYPDDNIDFEAIR